MKNIIDKKKFSYSRLNTFSHCPQKYKIQYIDLISNDNESIEAYMGSRVHEVLESLYSIDDLKNQYIPFDKLIDLFDEYDFRLTHSRFV